MLFEERQPAFLNIRASCGTGFKRNVPGSLKLSIFESTGLARLDCHVWGIMLEKHHKLQPKSKMTNS